MRSAWWELPVYCRPSLSGIMFTIPPFWDNSRTDMIKGACIRHLQGAYRGGRLSTKPKQGLIGLNKPGLIGVKGSTAPPSPPPRAVWRSLTTSSNIFRANPESFWQSVAVCGPHSGGFGRKEKWQQMEPVLGLLRTVVLVRKLFSRFCFRPSAVPDVSELPPKTGNIGREPQ